MFFLPEYYGGENCLIEISADKLSEMEERIDPCICEDIYKEYFDYVLENKNLAYPEDINEGFEIFQHLINVPQ